MLRSPSIPSIAALGSLLLTIFAGRITTSQWLYIALFGPTPANFLVDFLREVASTERGWMLITIGCLIGFCFGAVTLGSMALSSAMPRFESQLAPTLSGFDRLIERGRINAPTARPIPPSQRWRAEPGVRMASRDEIRAGLSKNLAGLWRYGLALSAARDVAEDLVQATAVRALERAEQFQSGTRIDRWLFSILRSIWLNEIRYRRIRAGEGCIAADEVIIDGEAEIETNMFAGQVLNAVRRLPERQREAILLVYVEGLSYAEAAEFLGTPMGTVMSRLAAARLALSKLTPPDDRHAVRRNGQSSD